MIQTRINYNVSELPDSLYVTSTEFNKIFDNKKFIVPFSVLHINCRSLSKNFTNLLAYIHTVDRVFCVIAVSEIWLRPEHTCLYNIPGYIFVAVCTSECTGGGVGLFIWQDFCFMPRDDLCISDNNTDNVFVELSPIHVIIGCVYRKPNTDINNFTIGMDNLLSKINSEKKQAFIAGDFNIN